tara:strand:+ start:208 stop:726 length:519 start_codon:yes stop_codon:yes gene_type:complete
MIIKVLISFLLLVVCLVACETTPSHTSITPPTDPWNSLYQSVASPDTALWWPLLFSGFLAIAAGLVNSFVFGRGSKLFILGIVLACIPPIADYTLRQSAFVVSLTVLSISIMLIVWVGGKWFGWRGFRREMEPIAQNLKENNYTPEEAAAIIETTVSQKPKGLMKPKKGVST